MIKNSRLYKTISKTTLKKLYWTYIIHLMNKSITLAFLFMSQFVWTQDIDLSYYLPQDISYDQSIPTPKEIIGHEVGEWHVTHDKLYESRRNTPRT